MRWVCARRDFEQARLDPPLVVGVFKRRAYEQGWEEKLDVLRGRTIVQSGLAYHKA